MNTISLLPAVSAYREERIKELEKLGYSQGLSDSARADELRRIVILCEGLERQQELLTRIVAQPRFSDK